MAWLADPSGDTQVQQTSSTGTPERRMAEMLRALARKVATAAGAS